MPTITLKVALVSLGTQTEDPFDQLVFYLYRHLTHTCLVAVSVTESVFAELAPLDIVRPLINERDQCLQGICDQEMEQASRIISTHWRYPKLSCRQRSYRLPVRQGSYRLRVCSCLYSAGFRHSRSIGGSG